MTATIPSRTLPLSRWPAHRLAMWAFLVNEGFLFGSLLAAGLFLRLGGPVPWPRPGEAFALGPVLLATLILIVSSATLNEALDALRRGNLVFCRRWLSATAVLGTAFLGIQGYEWWDVARVAAEILPSGVTPWLNNPWGAATFLQIFFLATGLHGLHVAAGLALMAWLLLTATETNERRLESVALYWHFVDLVWIFILSTLYLA